MAEAEYYALVHGAAHALGLQAFLLDIGIELVVMVETDSSSARSSSSRKGLGKQRHAQTRFLWLQDRVADSSVNIRCVGTNDNVSDVLTKVVARPLMLKHLEVMQVETVSRDVFHKDV